MARAAVRPFFDHSRVMASLVQAACSRSQLLISKQNRLVPILVLLQVYLNMVRSLLLVIDHQVSHSVQSKRSVSC